MKQSAVFLSVCLALALVGPSMGSVVTRPSKDTMLDDFSKWVKQDRAQFDKLDRSMASRMVRECSVNVCWALDASGSIDENSFDSERDFTTRVGSVMGFGQFPVKMGAVQYGTVVRPIQRLTADDSSFVLSVKRAKQLGGFTNVDGALLGCRFIINSAGDDARHIIIMTDGNANIGAEGFEQAESFRGTGGRVSVVSAGSFLNKDALQRLAGPGGNVYNVKSFGDDLEMIKISEQLGQSVCSKAS